MRIAVTDQYKSLASFVPTFKTKPLSYADCARLPEHHTRVLIPIVRSIPDLRSCNLEFFFEYDIFPRRILSALGEWQSENRSMRVGDVIVQQVSVPPLPISLKFVFAVRVLDVTQSPTQMSFTYGTLAGHVETGTSEFILVLRDNRLFAEIHTFSRPTHFLNRLVAPVLTRPYQQYCTDYALAHMRDTFLRVNPECAA